MKKYRRRGGTKHKLNKMDSYKARNLYDYWFSNYPGIKNPSDINTSDKFEFANEIGWVKLSLMQAARKAGYEFTRWDHWKEVYCDEV
tara:strand:+ start:3401 stop:3661 length:261 start_codon:yes stop_codon:yes gene_type:complete